LENSLNTKIIIRCDVVFPQSLFYSNIEEPGFFQLHIVIVGNIIACDIHIKQTKVTNKILVCQLKALWDRVTPDLTLARSENGKPINKLINLFSNIKAGKYGLALCAKCFFVLL